MGKFQCAQLRLQLAVKGHAECNQLNSPPLPSLYSGCGGLYWPTLCRVPVGTSQNYVLIHNSIRVPSVK